MPGQTTHQQVERRGEEPGAAAAGTSQRGQQHAVQRAHEDLGPTLGLSVIAGGDIGIKSSSWSGNIDGTMLIDQVLSLGGNVRLVSAGQILDNNPTETVDQRTYAQLLSYWDTLGLIKDSSENIASSTELGSRSRSSTMSSYSESVRPSSRYGT